MSEPPTPATYLLITGASSGIGREMAVSLSGQYRLILSGRDPGRLQQTRQACQAPDRHLCWARDLADVTTLAQALPAFLRENDARVTGF
ncbi:SDR family NAD(P)-dependent oxidoreductase, partial [Methylorubrum zatmanii]